METKTTSAAVKIMLSYNYCHFEISKSITPADGNSVTDAELDVARKDCMRLADKSIEQYKIAKHIEQRQESYRHQLESLTNSVERIQQKPESEWTPMDKARVKALEDKEWLASRANRDYDYEDDYDDTGMDDEFDQKRYLEPAEFK